MFAQVESTKIVHISKLTSTTNTLQQLKFKPVYIIICVYIVREQREDSTSTEYRILHICAIAVHLINMGYIENPTKSLLKVSLMLAKDTIT